MGSITSQWSPAFRAGKRSRLRYRDRWAPSRRNGAQLLELGKALVDNVTAPGSPGRNGAQLLELGKEQQQPQPRR